jgi:hypothetical protein
MGLLLGDFGLAMEDCPSIYGLFLSLVFQGPVSMILALRRNPNDQSAILGLQEQGYHQMGTPCVYRISGCSSARKGT